MPPRDYDSAPVAETLGLRDVVLGLAADLEGLRTGKVSPQDALARAALAKQIFNGVRLYVTASKFLESKATEAKQIPAAEGGTHD